MNRAFDFDDPANWRDLVTHQPATVAPQVGDSLTFDGTLSNANCNGLHGFGGPDNIADFASVGLVNNYNGTVTFAPDGSPEIATNTFTLNSGAIAQSGAGTDLSVLGTFTWTGGTLNNSNFNANVNIEGGGNITLPGAGNTITTGSTLNFSSFGGQLMTTHISGAGTLLLNGTNPDGIFVKANASVIRDVQQGSAGAVRGVDNLKTLTLNATAAQWGYVGSGSDTLGLRVIVNPVGFFYLNGQVTLALTGGNATTPGYTQNSGTTLQIQSGCVLDASASSGVLINGGQVSLTCNADLGVDNQIASVKGNFTMTDGSIGFQTPIQIGDSFAWVIFGCTNDVRWAGGSFNPGVDGGGLLSTFANEWQILGKMTIDASNPSKPTIAPVVLNVPPGQPTPKRTWQVIESGPDGSITGDAPVVPTGWTTTPITQNGKTTGYKVNYTG